MRQGFRIGRLLGIDLIVDWSWVFIFLLMTWNVSIAFLQWHPAWGYAGSVGLAGTTSLLFFASVLAHELAHALVATSMGMKVTNIRLFLFGGVSNIESEPPSPRAELLMAIVGPLMSIGIGLNLVAIASRLVSIDPHDPLESVARTGAFATLLLWLGPVNVMVGLFNLLPAFPLDGGRMLRALFWRMTRDLSKATLWASSIGQAIGWLFIVFGIATFFGARFAWFDGGATGGLWLAFIGWFVTSAASRGYVNVRIQEALEGVTVEHLMRRGGLVAPPSVTVSALVDGWFLRSADHSFPVVDDERLVGLVSAGDVRRAPRDTWASAIVAEIMTPIDRLVVVHPRDEVVAAMRKLAQIDVEQLPVVVDGRLVGILERRQVARWLELRLDPTSQKPSHAT